MIMVLDDFYGIERVQEIGGDIIRTIANDRCGREQLLPSRIDHRGLSSPSITDNDFISI